MTPPTQNSFETTYNFNTTYIPDIPAGSAYVITNAALAPTSCQATCHSDQQVADTNPPALPASRWRRTWIGVADARPLATNNPGDAVCKNCHGDFAGGWNLVEADASTTDHTDPYTPNTGDRMSQHSVCQTCHGWGNVNYSATWADTALPRHGDGSITMNGPQPTTGAGYINTGVNAGGCAKACHLPTLVMNTTQRLAGELRRLRFRRLCELSQRRANHVSTCAECHGGRDEPDRHRRNTSALQ